MSGYRLLSLPMPSTLPGNPLPPKGPLCCRHFCDSAVPLFSDEALQRFKGSRRGRCIHTRMQACILDTGFRSGIIRCNQQLTVGLTRAGTPPLSVPPFFLLFLGRCLTPSSRLLHWRPSSTTTFAGKRLPRDRAAVRPAFSLRPVSAPLSLKVHTDTSS